MVRKANIITDMNQKLKLTDKSSISAVVNDMTTEEKVSLLSAASACMTVAIPERDIPALRIYDGATGVNPTEIIMDYMYSHPKNAEKLNWMKAQEITYASLEEMKEKYREDPVMSDFIRHTEALRTSGKDFLCLLSGVNIGASFNVHNAEECGRSIGWELRDSHVDVCLGPNVDIQRDPLGGRNYEMYGEDPCLVSNIASAFIRGMQQTGVGACAKHFIANNQETQRQTKDNHVSERTLREIYAPGFVKAVREAKTKTVMSAYCSVNGTFASYNKKLLTEWLKKEWGFEGVIVSDYGAVKEEKAKAIEAGLDLILTGPNDMTDCLKAAKEKWTEEELNDHVGRILKLIVDLREEQEAVPAEYDPEAILQKQCVAIADGAVLLKNDDKVLPLRDTKKIAFWGKGSKNMLECGSGSTTVLTSIHTNVYEETAARLGNDKVSFEEWSDADTLVYVATAQGGEGADRASMDLDQEDSVKLPAILKEAKEKGLKSIVILNVSGPVEMRHWVDYADAILCVFIPGSMGGRATAELLLGERFPGGRLPVTFPVRYEDTPSYPNYPGEYNDVYYGEGIFVGYRNYEKRKIAVQFPFGYGLGYTSFYQKTDMGQAVFDIDSEQELHIPVSVENVGTEKGSQVIQLYVSECNPHILRPEKELKAFKKITLDAGEKATLGIVLNAEDLACFDPKKGEWVTPTGLYQLLLGTSSADIFATVPLQVIGKNPYAIGPDTILDEVLKKQDAIHIMEQYLPGISTNEMLRLLADRKLGDALSMIAIMYIPDAVKMNDMLQEMYRKLAEID